MPKRLQVDLSPIKGECLRCGNGSLTIYKDGAACSNCSPAWLEPMLSTAMERWRKAHPDTEVVGG